MEQFLNVVRSASLAVKNDRTPRSTFNHMISECQEVDEELTALEQGLPPGDDGVVGESIDTIACLLDIIFQIKPDITDQELIDIMRRKCNKWITLYGAAA